MDLRNHRAIYFTLILGCAGMYLVNYQKNFAFIGYALFISACGRLVKEVSDYKAQLDKLIIHSTLERNCNVFMELEIVIEEVLRHSSVDHLFKKLKEKDVIYELDKNEWIKNLLSNYKMKYKTSIGRVRFEIKSNLIRVNGDITFADTIDYAFYIPYKWGEGTQEDDTGIERGLEIRIGVINGFIKLRIGRFSKEYTQKILKEDIAVDVYQEYETITSFPLIYFAPYHFLPERYLNMSLRADQSYHTDSSINILKKIEVLVRNYNSLCNRSEWEKIREEFIDKREPWLKQEGFRSTYDDDFARLYYPNTIGYENRYLLVVFINSCNEEERLYGDDNGYSDYREYRKYP